MSPSDATAIFSTVANSFPGWLTAQYYFSPGTCAALNHGGIVVLGVGLVIDNPIVTGVGAVGTIASYIGCPEGGLLLVGPDGDCKAGSGEAATLMLHSSWVCGAGGFDFRRRRGRARPDHARYIP